MKQFALHATIVVCLITLLAPVCVHGQTTGKTLTGVAAFSSITSSGAIDIEFRQSNAYSTPKVVLYGTKAQLEKIKVSSVNGVLQFTQTGNMTLTSRSSAPRAVVTNSQLENVLITGSCDFKVSGALTGKTLSVKISGSGDFEVLKAQYANVSVQVSGSGDVDLNGLTCGSLTVALSGSGDVDISGTAKTGKLNISGSGDIDAAKCKIGAVIANISGSGKIQVHSVSSLKATVTGSGSIEYYGNPALTTTTSKKVRRIGR